MTAHELAKKLLQGPDVMVTVRGYEGGVDEIKHIEPPQELALNANTQSWNGSHEYTRYADEFEVRKLVKIQAVHLSAYGGIE